jgi:hypothetical protein
VKIKSNKPMTSLLGLAFEGQGVSAALMRRHGADLSVERFRRLKLSLDPLTDESELVGREIRHQLDGAQIRERRCLVCLPLTWLLALRVDFPSLADEGPAAFESFLEIQAERDFPFPLADLRMSLSRYETPEGDAGANIAAIPAARLEALLAALKSAGLRVRDVVPSVSALAGLGADQFSSSNSLARKQGRAVVVGGPNGADLVVSAGGGIVAMRHLQDGAATASGHTDGLDVQAIGKHLRITLGNLPKVLLGELRSGEAFADADVAEPLAAKLTEAMRHAGAPGQAVAGDLRTRVELSRLESSAATDLPPGLIAALSRRMVGQSLEFEFLTPWLPASATRPRPRVTRRTVWAAAGAVALVAALVGTVGHQIWRLGQLEAEWETLGPKAAVVESLQEQIRAVRPWFDDTLPTLEVMRLLAQAFPEQGTVWATHLQIKDGSTISMAGRAVGNDALLPVLDRIKGATGVEDLRVVQLRETAGRGDEMSFVLSFRWNSGGRSGS